MDVVTMGLSLGILAFAALGQALMGFGGGLIAIPLLSLLLGVKDAVLLGLVMQVLVGLIAVRSWHSLDWKGLSPLLLSFLAMTLVGTFFLGAINESLLRLVLAIFILMFLLKSIFWQDARMIPSRHPLWAILAGGSGGVLQGMLGTGGPPLVIYLNETVARKDEIRNALLLLLMASNILRIGAAIPAGLYHAKLMPLVWWSIPCVMVSMVIGHRLHAAVSERLYRQAILLLLTGSCISLLVKSF